ncbi:MAG: very short patch repair endonuclease [Nitrosopumilaceae archaeon]
MPDVFSKSKRSEIMSKIRSKGTKLDLTMEKLLKAYKIKYQIYPQIYGCPDFFIKKNVVVFCDSSFWHGRNWSILKKKLAKGNNSDYWLKHIARNRKRDRFVSKKLKSAGYKVIRFWDDDIYKRPEWCVNAIKSKI